MVSLPRVGETILGKYRIVRERGRGGMGVVYEAVNIATDGHVALKMLSRDASANSELVERMSREARATARLRSRFVCRVFDHERTSAGLPVLVMELLEGRDLGTELRERGALPIGEAVSYVLQACAGVADAHASGVIHRDIKPSNLFLDTRDVADKTVRVLDFGISKILESDEPELTAPLDAVGTITYMSPEQLRGLQTIDARTDVWALGVVLYRALMGRAIVGGTSAEVAGRVLDDKPMARVDRPDAPRALVDVIARALEKDAAARFSDARALGLALQSFSDSSPTTKLAVNELSAAPTTTSRAKSLLADYGGEDDTTETHHADDRVDPTKAEPTTAPTRSNWEMTHDAPTIDMSPPAIARLGDDERRSPSPVRGAVRNLARSSHRHRSILFALGAVALLATAIATILGTRGSTALTPPTVATATPTPIEVSPMVPPSPSPSPSPPPVVVIAPLDTSPPTSSAARRPGAPLPGSSSTPRARPTTKGPTPITTSTPPRDENDNPVRF